MYKGDKWTCRFSLLWLYITLNYLGRIHRVTFAELMNEYRKQTFRHLAAKLHNQLAPRLGNAEEQHHFEKLPGIPSGEKDGPSPGMWSLISHTAHYLPALPSLPLTFNLPELLPFLIHLLPEEQADVGRGDSLME